MLSLNELSKFEVIFEDELCIAYKPPKPITSKHAIIIPKTVLPTLTGIKENVDQVESGGKLQAESVVPFENIKIDKDTDHGAACPENEQKSTENSVSHVTKGSGKDKTLGPSFDALTMDDLKQNSDKERMLGHLLLKCKDVALRLGLVNGFRMIINDNGAVSDNEESCYFHIHVVGGKKMKGLFGF